MDFENLSALLNSNAGEELVLYLQKQVEDIEQEEKEQLGAILLASNPQSEEMIALKVVARTKDKVKKILEDILALKNYSKAEPEKLDETFGIQ